MPDQVRHDVWVCFLLSSRFHKFDNGCGWRIIWRPQRAALRKNHDPHKNHNPCKNHDPRKTAIHPYNLPFIAGRASVPCDSSVGRASVPALKKPLCLAIPRRAGLPARFEKKTMKRNRMDAITDEAVTIDNRQKNP
jgi:hypothetical protein